MEKKQSFSDMEIMSFDPMKATSPPYWLSYHAWFCIPCGKTRIMSLTQERSILTNVTFLTGMLSHIDAKSGKGNLYISLVQIFRQ